MEFSENKIYEKKDKKYYQELFTFTRENPSVHNRQFFVDQHRPLIKYCLAKYAPEIAGAYFEDFTSETILELLKNCDRIDFNKTYGQVQAYMTQVLLWRIKNFKQGYGRFNSQIGRSFTENQAIEITADEIRWKYIYDEYEKKRIEEIDRKEKEEDYLNYRLEDILDDKGGHLDEVDKFVIKKTIEGLSMRDISKILGPKRVNLYDRLRRLGRRIKLGRPAISAKKTNMVKEKVKEYYAKEKEEKNKNS